MKTLKTILIGVAVLALTVSCEKKWSCDCTDTFDGKLVKKNISEFMKKKEAKEYCKSINDVKLGHDTYTDCTLSKSPQ